MLKLSYILSLIKTFTNSWLSLLKNTHKIISQQNVSQYLEGFYYMSFNSKMLTIINHYTFLDLFKKVFFKKIFHYLGRYSITIVVF